MPIPEEHKAKVEKIREYMGKWFEEECDPENGDVSLCLPDPMGNHYDPEDWTYCVVVHDDGTHVASRFKLGSLYAFQQEIL